MSPYLEAAVATTATFQNNTVDITTWLQLLEMESEYLFRSGSEKSCFYFLFAKKLAGADKHTQKADKGRYTLDGCRWNFLQE